MSGNLYRVDILHLLDQDATALLSCWSEAIELGQPPRISNEALVEAFHERRSLSRVLKYAREDLRDEEIAMIPFLLPHQKIRLRQRLVRAHYLSSLQARIDEIEYRWDGLLLNQALCARYEALIHEIDVPFYAREQDKSEQLQKRVDDSEKPLAWFGACRLAPLLSDTMVELSAGNTLAIKNLLTEIDRKNVYLGWSRSFTLSFFNLVPACFSGTRLPIDSLQEAGTLLTYTNLIIVNAALIMECYLVLKNTFSGAYSTRRDHSRVSVSDQFLTQIHQRRFVLLNWLFLSFLHVAAFLCFSGVMSVWPWGPVFGLGCRLVQILLSSARFRDEETIYFANKKRFEEQINALNLLEQELLRDLRYLQDEDEQFRLRLKLKQINEDRLALEDACHKSTQEWEIKKDEYHMQSILSSCFFAGVMMFTCLIVPATILAPPIGLAIACAGAAVCIIFVIGLSVMRTHFSNERTRQEMLHVHQKPGSELETLPQRQLERYMRRFIELKAAPPHPHTTLEMKQCYLRMRQLVTHSDAHKQILERQKINLWLDMTRDLLMPIIGLTMLVFLPTPIGIGAIVGCFLVYIIAKKALEAYRPIMSLPLSFDQDAYDEFAKSPAVDILTRQDLKIKKTIRAHIETSNENEIDDLTTDFGGLAT